MKATVKTQMKSIRIDQPEWEGVNIANAQAICVFAGKMFEKHADTAADEDILVYKGNEPWPMARSESAPGGERIIDVVTAGPWWRPFSYQFAHEYCHTFTKHWLLDYSHHNMWLAETLCEVAALWAIVKMGEDYKTADAPSFEGWDEIGVAFQNFVPAHTEGRQFFATPAAFAAWLTPRLPDCYKMSKPDNFELNKTAANYLLPFFLDDPLMWRVTKYINIGQKIENDFPQYLRDWRATVPEELRGHVEKFAAIVGFPIT